MKNRLLILWRILSKVVLAPVILAMLLPYFEPTHIQTQSLETSQFDLTRLVFETVEGDYGNIYNVIQDKDGFLWLAGVNSAIKYNGYESETVYSGETVSALFEDSEGLIWMDVLMPVMDGLEATRHIKATDAGAHTKIVAITAHALEKERREILSAW